MTLEQSPVEPTLCKADIALREAFPRIEQGKDYPFTTGGQWSTADLIFHLLAQTGPAHLTACTWSVSEATTLRVAQALKSGQLLSINFLVDYRVQVRTPSFLALARDHFSAVRVSSIHAKAFIIDNDEWTLCNVGSANWTSNPRIEVGHLSTNPKVAAFHKNWIHAEIRNAQPFGADMTKRGKRDARE